MRGRKPKPVAFRLLNGNPSGRPIPDGGRIASALPSCPPHLDAEAKKEWKRVLKELRNLGLLSRVDRAALAAYCQLWSRVVKLEGIVQRTGEVLSDKVVKRHYGRKDSNGVAEEIVNERTKFYRSPYAIELQACYERMHSFLSEFGLTPSSRARLGIREHTEEDDELERFLQSRGI
jgi:P27 family predicted phage terminase small subunit